VPKTKIFLLLLRVEKLNPATSMKSVPTTKEYNWLDIESVRKTNHTLRVPILILNGAFVPFYAFRVQARLTYMHKFVLQTKMSTSSFSLAKFKSSLFALFSFTSLSLYLTIVTKSTFS